MKLYDENKNERLNIASRILSGLLANKNIVKDNGGYGWGIVNFTEEELAKYSLSFADKLINATEGGYENSNIHY
jgi:hypothetical protein